MDNNNINFIVKEQEEILPENLSGVIKPKKKLDSLIESMVILLVDYYNAYFKQNELKPIHDLKGDAELIRTNTQYHPPLICTLMITRMIDTNQGHGLAQLLRNTYAAFVEVGCNPYDAVSNVLSMFYIKFDENGSASLEVSDVAEITVPTDLEAALLDNIKDDYATEN